MFFTNSQSSDSGDWLSSQFTQGAIMDEKKTTDKPSPHSPIKCTVGSEPAAGVLNLGDKAPPLSLGQWLAGKPIKAIESGVIHVIEFWASWCGPCQEMMPELSRMQASFPEVVFLSVAVWEENETDPKAFVAQLGGSITHRVALDAPRKPQPGDEIENTGQMAHDWMSAAGESGVPTAFVVDRAGTIAWIGHPAELDEILPRVIAGSHVIDQENRLIDKTLEQLRLDPTLNIDPSVFNELFSFRVPDLRTADLDWLKPAPIAPAPKLATEPAAKSGGLFGRLMGRPSAPATAPAAALEPASTGLNVFGPPAAGRVVAYLFTTSINGDGFEPGWEVLDEAKLQSLPQLHTDIDFVALVRSPMKLEELYDKDYRDELAAWGAELGWRIGFDLLGFEGDAPQATPTINSIVQRWQEQFRLAHLPVAALVGPSGDCIWVGSPIQLGQALLKSKTKQTSTAWAATELLFWQRLMASAVANERLAGVQDDRQMAGLGNEISPLELIQEIAALETWEAAVKSLNEQLPWRTERWRVFLLQLESAKARFDRSKGLTGKALAERFDALTNEFAENAEQSSVVYDWRKLIKIGAEMLGLEANPHEPLESSALLAAEGHPLTGALVKSAELYQKTVIEESQEGSFTPSPLAFIEFKLNRFDEAVAVQERMIAEFDRWLTGLKASLEMTAEQDEMEIASDDLLRFMVNMTLGEPPEDYRKNLVKLLEIYRKHAAEA